MKHKQEIQASRETLQKLWEEGLSGLKLLEQHSATIDSFLADRFAELSGGDQGLALVALGGYGRRELFPFSDIDLMLLHSPKLKGVVLEKAVETILYPLWDAGLEVGYGVRTVSQSINDCKRDFHLQVAMLDARLITGSADLFDNLQRAYKKKFIEGRRREFLRNMSAGREERVARFGGHSFQLEPDIKEGHGGFRDIQAILWTAQAVFGLKGWEGLEEAGIFRPEERLALEDSFNNLVMIRNRLHYLSGRKNDQLFFEHQEEIARALGYKDSRSILAVEIFMQEVYGYLETVAIAADLFFEHLDEVVGSTRKGRDNRILEEGLEVINGRIHLTGSELLTGKPLLLMKLFAQAARTGLPIHFRSRQAISSNLGLVNDDFRRSRRVAGAFFDTIGSSNPLPVLAAMLETGFLTAYIPEMAPLESLAQHDVFHIYTVDRHLLQTVQELDGLSHEQEKIFSRLPNQAILYLAGLLHDIGKGRGGQHDQVGAEISAEVGRRLGLPAAELEKQVFLVGNHLFFSHIAQRRDLEDEEVIFHCARTIGDLERLDLLYLLSIADARATGPKAWSEWKGGLFQELYLRVAQVLDQSELIEPDRQQAGRWMREQVAEVFGAEPPVDLAILPEDYLLNFTVQEVAEHLRLNRKLAAKGVLMVPADHNDHWSVLVVSHDRTGLLSLICGTLALHNLNVLSAKIHTWQDSTVIDVLDVKPVFNNNFNDQDWSALAGDLDLALNNKLGVTHRLAAKKKQDRSAPGPDRQYPATVRVDNRSSSFFTIFEVFATDHPSLLYDITRALADFDISIAKAMISTRQGQLIDVFYVVSGEGMKVTDEVFLEEIQQSLVFAATKNGG